ncbi:hypothetical protein bthur0005_62370 [Bacillus thuringiensis serovar pakistani str. T13001]|nr:hypothetical protein bthur0005_62370 [Bacillus thuringiensis serovar pakistani str. T13001]
MLFKTKIEASKSKILLSVFQIFCSTIGFFSISLSNSLLCSLNLRCSTLNDFSSSSIPPFKTAAPLFVYSFHILPSTSAIHIHRQSPYKWIPNHHNVCIDQLDALKWLSHFQSFVVSSFHSPAIFWVECTTTYSLTHSVELCIQSPSKSKYSSPQ